MEFTRLPCTMGILTKNENPKNDEKNWFATNDANNVYIRLLTLFLSKGVPNLSLKKVWTDLKDLLGFIIFLTKQQNMGVFLIYRVDKVDNRKSLLNSLPNSLPKKSVFCHKKNHEIGQ